MTQTTLIQVRVDNETKRKSDALFADLGLDTPTAIRIFLNQAIRHDGLPFEVVKPQPNAQTLAAMFENMEITSKSYKNFGEILQEVKIEMLEEENAEN